MNFQLRAFFALLISLLLIGCGDDTAEPGTKSCDFGERLNPITGQCIPVQTANNVNNVNNVNNQNNVNNVNNLNNVNNTNNVNNVNNTNNMNDMGMDDGVSERCDPALDSDNDGLTNDCECILGTSSYEMDSDNDGLNDNVEDANGNCSVDPGVETDPRSADTDADGATDSEEIAANSNPLDQDSDDDGVLDGAEIASGCMDPNSEDTDNDTLPDSVEDGDLNGQIGNCVNRVYNPTCALGESDPCQADTDGDGTPDVDEAQYRACRPEDTNNLATPNLLLNMVGDYQLAYDSGVTTSVVTSSGGAVEAHVFEDITHKYTGFIASLTPPGGETLPSRLDDHIVSEMQALYPSAVRRVGGRQVTTHDGFKANVGAIVDLPNNTALHTARDTILARLAGQAPGNLSNTLTGTLNGNNSEPTLLVYEVIARSQTQYIVVGAVVTLSDYQNDAAFSGIRVDDLTGGTAVAGSMEMLTVDCVSYRVTAKPKVDVIISIDGSGSMSDEQAALQNFAVDFTTLLTNSNLDWRTAVTRPDCGSNAALSQEAQNLFGGASCGPSIPISIPGFPGIGGDTGELVNGDFTADPMELRRRLDPGVFSGGGEYTISALTAAADRALPRDNQNPAKFREDAAVILIAITDEEDEFFQDDLSFGNTSNITLTMAEQTELENKTSDWVNFLLKPELGATAFGIVWPTGEQCQPNGSFVAHAVSHIANETGGTVGSICQADITNTLRVIAEATAGIASGLRLRGVPIAPTIEVINGSATTGMILPLNRSRTQGFDYDSIVNRVSFTGANTPQTGDRVVIPYRRWENSVFVCTANDECPAEQKLKCVDGECR